MFGFYKIAISVPQLKIANPEFNGIAILENVKHAEKEKSAIVLFPELSITTYSCGDLFHNAELIKSTEEAILQLCQKLKSFNTVAVIGAPIFHRNVLYNCAIVIHKGKILGVVPKSFLPNYREFYEKRWFKSGKDIKNDTIFLARQEAPFGTDLIFTSKDSEISFAIEICEDLWVPIPPSSYYSLAGANLILNLSASNELIGKNEYRTELIKHQSAKNICAYAFCSAGTYESSAETVFSGHCALFENGMKLLEKRNFSTINQLYFVDIDCQKLNYLRNSESSFYDEKIPLYRRILISNIYKSKKILRTYDPYPFVPREKSRRDERCEEILNIQSSAIARRFLHTKSRKAVIGISGGLDSTLALLATIKAFQIINLTSKDIIAVTMPGFGTGSRTLNNATKLAKALNCDFRKIDITRVCKIHLKDIGRNTKKHDITFENAQARERTQILMDIANAENALVIGTGDLSEIALGWSTFNGDHISMYSANCGIPKTLVRYIIEWIAEKSSPKVHNILVDILNTPISPELLPSRRGEKFIQETEKILGPYAL
ncbi:MAG TPA: NAD(+) synthase, partial [Victivallales bacterium]|nr:NAD(+) synthase [Victivallales bacterium]